ncbi:uncharacterized protein LOC113521760 [Galleria mellonella]|uniref:Uncharacterized protein LOC113521760 n=1 Tax=Galleria mellonella TaxID=7137 RepID=A0A6J1X852_GALME|nr:uncharacterized protein LOC113521760 [Galleria mellonella]
MDLNSQKQFTFNFKDIIIDEIALEGLEGITLDLLWRRIEKRTSSQITDKMKIRFWNYIIDSKNINLYQLPDAMPRIQIIDRFTIVDEQSGHLKDPDDYIDGPYEYHPVENEYGSCVNYKKRKLLDKETIKELPYPKVESKYNDFLVLVASLEERWHALAPHLPISYLAQLSPVHYCILELTGKSRHNGQMTVGKTNLTKIVKDPKHLFYNRKLLQDLDLIRVVFLTQMLAGRGVKSLIVRLKRFYKSVILSMPKVGRIHDLLCYLKEQPNYSERTDEIIKKGFISQQMNRRLQKTINVFNFGEKLVDENPTTTGNKRKRPVTRRYISLSSKSDESSNSDEEPTEVPPKFQYKVGVNLLRQAYERFLDAGLQGLTQVELAYMLGIEFYTARTICKVYRAKGILRECLVDKGRQRTARFIAVATTGQTDVKYAEEKKKLLEYLDMSKSLQNSNTPSVSGENTVNIKTEKDGSNINSDGAENDIMEVTAFDGNENGDRKSLLNSKKTLTLRQLKFANGLLKIVREKLFISGYQTLSNIVANEIGEAPMDTKALKSFLLKLATDGQIKILRLKWPTPQPKYSILICAPHIKATDPIIKAKHKDICMRAYLSKETKVKEAISSSIKKPVSKFSLPRYVKIQKLHEFVAKLAYFNDTKVLSDLPFGFGCLHDLILEMTVDFAIGNLSNFGNLNVSNLIVNEETLYLKLKDAPPKLYKELLQSKSLQNSLKSNLKTLAVLGLIQLIAQPSGADSTSFIPGYMYYVNRHAKIIDTTGVWPRKNIDITDLERSFYFETLEDVSNFWTAVFQISTKTVIELPSREQNKKIIPPVRTQKEASQLLAGERSGDGMGPCGYDSSFFMDIPRLWHKSVNVKIDPKINKILTKRAKFPVIEKPVTKMRKKIFKPTKVVTEEVTSPVKIRKRKRTNDSLITWTNEEDMIIMMCKTAITIMSPTSQPGCLRVRNLVAKDILSLKDPKKTQSICHRRATVLDSNPVLVYERERLLSELRRRRNLLEKYEGFLRKLRIRYPTNIGKYTSESRLPMLELVYIINQVRNSKTFTHPKPCVAFNLEDFYKNYTIVPSSANKPYNTYKSKHESELELPTIKETIMFTVLSCNQEVHISVAKKIFIMFKMYPEVLLRKAVDQLRKCGAITPKEKIFNNKLHKINLQDLVDSSYKTSAAYQRRWICRLNSEFPDDIAKVLECDLSEKEINGLPGINCVCCELNTCGLLDIVTVTPPVYTGPSDSTISEEHLSVIDIETKYKLKSGKLKLINLSSLQTFSELYKSLNIEESLNSFSRKAIIKYTDDNVVDFEDKIISHLNIKCEKGATFNELKKITGYNKKTLIDRLTELEKMNTIKRVGYYDNCVILLQFCKPWTVILDKQTIIPSPWLTLELSIKLDVLLKWCGVILNKIFECPGCSIMYLSETFELITAKSIQDICEFLRDCKCLSMKVMENHEPDLFSDDEIEFELQDYNPYESPENIIVFPEKDAISKYSYIRKNIINDYHKEKVNT